MSEQAEEITVTIKSSGDKKYEVSAPTNLTVAEFKEVVATHTEIPADRQRLIYSGKVLKDGDSLASYKIQNGHTIHLVKGAPKAGSSPGPAAATTTTPTTSSTDSQANTSVPQNIAAGQGSFNPLAGLTGARYAGYNVPMPSMEQLGFGADGMQLPDENQMEQMMENPLFQEGMRSMLNDPQMLDYMIQQSPQLAAMGPAAREMLQSDYFRNMLSNPQMMRSMMQMQRMMGGPGAGGATSAFPAPGNPSSTTTTTTTESSNTNTESTSTPATGGTAPAANPFAALFGGAGGMGANPFALGGAGGDAASNPFLNPALMGMLGGGAGAGAGSATAAPVDTRPPEEVFESQLRQLNDMGFFDFDRNVRALRRSGGSVEGAIESLLNGTI